MSAGLWSAIHVVGGWAVVIANGAAGLWALGSIRWAVLRHRSLWWLIGTAWTLVFVQMTTGVVLMRAADVAAPAFHVFYGACGAVAVALVLGYRSQLEHRRYELFGFGALFIMGLAIRAMFLGN